MILNDLKNFIFKVFRNDFDFTTSKQQIFETQLLNFSLTESKTKPHCKNIILNVLDDTKSFPINVRG